jgi:hypothetical protein
MIDLKIVHAILFAPMSKLSGRYTAEELLNAELQGSNPLIEQFLYERDNILLVGKEKANKSTLALQMCCSLSSAEPLFGEYDVPRPINCVYIQAEGKLASTQSNLRQMTRVIPIDKTKILFLYYPSIPINRPEGIHQIFKDIDSWQRPEVIVIDPLYQSVAGDISSQPDSSAMTANLRHLSEKYECSIILVHHAHRPRKDKEGSIIDEGDDSIFGSFVWKAFPDSVWLIEKVQGHKAHRRYSCSTQRMGNVVESVDLNLVEPSPFYLQIREGKPIDIVIEGNLNCEPFTIADIVSRTGRHRRHISESLYRLIHQGKVSILDDKSKPILFKKST